ncbi:hypothetical protein GN956_G19233 [Arapaima gigas]
MLAKTAARAERGCRRTSFGVRLSSGRAAAARMAGGAEQLATGQRSVWFLLPCSGNGRKYSPLTASSSNAKSLPPGRGSPKLLDGLPG